MKLAMIPLGDDDKDKDSSGDLPEESVSKDDKDAAQDILDAIKTGDAELFARALKNFVAGC